MSVASCEDTMRDLGCVWEWQPIADGMLLHVDHGPDGVTGTIEGDDDSDCARKWHDLHAQAIEENDGYDLTPASAHRYRGVLVPDGSCIDIVAALRESLGVPS